MNNYEIRSASGLKASNRVLTGEIPYNSHSSQIAERGRVFREIIKPGAFRYGDVRALINHETYPVLGRTSSGTLKLEDTPQSLRYALTLPNTSAANDLLESVVRGDMSGVSFRFFVQEDGETWTRDADGVLHTLTNVDIDEISFVGNPAYPEATVSARSLERWKQAEEISEGEAGASLELKRKRLDIAERE